MKRLYFICFLNAFHKSLSGEEGIKTALSVLSFNVFGTFCPSIYIDTAVSEFSIQAFFSNVLTTSDTFSLLY